MLLRAKYLCFLFLPLSLVAQVNRNPVLLEQGTFGRVYDLCKQGENLFIAGGTGFYKYDFHQAERLNKQLTLPKEVIELCPSDSGLFLGSMNEGLWHYNTSTHAAKPLVGPGSSTALPNNRVGYIYGWHNDLLWFESHLKGLCSWNAQSGLKVYAPSADFPELKHRGTNIITGFIPFPSDSDKAWVASLNGVFVLDLKQAKFVEHFPLNQGNQLNDYPYSKREKAIRSLVYHQGYLYAGTWGGGLLQINPNDGSFTKHIFEEPYPLTSIRNNIRALQLIGDSLLLMATPHSALRFFNLSSASYKTLDQLSPSRDLAAIGYCLVDDSSWYVVKPDGLWELRKEEQGLKAFPSGQLVMDVLPSSSTGFYYTLYNTERKVYHYPEKKEILAPGENLKGFNNQFSLLKFKDKNVLISPFHAYLEREDGSFQQLPNNFNIEESASFVLCSAIDAKKGMLYRGRKNGSIERVNLSNFESSVFWLPKQRNWIKDMTLYKGVLYYAAEQQLGLLHEDSLKSISIELVCKNLGIGQSNFIQIASGDNRIYFGTEEDGVVSSSTNLSHFKKESTGSYLHGLNGLCFRDAKLYVSFDKGVWVGKEHEGKFYSSRYGFGRPRGLKASSKRVFLFTNKGLFDISSIYKLPKLKPGSPFLKTVRVMDRQLALPINQLNIAPNENWLRLKLGAKAPGATELLEITYRLKGLHDDWRGLEGDNSLAYSGLEPGKYRLELRSSLLGERDAIKPVLQFKVEYAWYENPYYQVLALIILLTLVFSVFRVRIKALKREQQLKKELDQLELQMMKVQMNPHFLFNALNSVRYYILKENADEASNYLARFSKLLRFMLKISRKPSVLLKDEMEGIRLYLEFEQIRFSQAFSYRIDIDPAINQSEVSIPSMIIQPFVENAIWHGFKGLERPAKLNITINKRQDRLQLLIVDNGVGREASSLLSAKAHESQGLDITKARLAALSKIKAEEYLFEIEDLYEGGKPTGTQVKIELPYESMDY